MKLQALKAGGFHLTLGVYPERRSFSTRTLGGEVEVPDHLAEQDRAVVAAAVTAGIFSIVEDTDRADSARFKIFAGYNGVSLNTEIDLGNTEATVALAFQQGDGTYLAEGTDFTVTDGVLTLDTDQSGETIVVLYTVP